MIEIIGTELYQWDTGRSVNVTTAGATHVHFANQGDSKAVKMGLVNSEAKIPDYLLQTGKQLCVYAVANGVTIERKMFSVTKRERPEDYVYDEDQRNFIYELVQSAEDATEAANLATQNANDAAAKALQAASSWAMVGKASGDSIAINNAVEQPFAGFHIFGKTTQNGTPTPDAPAELVSVGDSGSITVNVAGENDSQSMTVATPNGLPGIPVTSGGNYTDANGQQWICDEIDFGRGKLVVRILSEAITGMPQFRETPDWIGRFVADNCLSAFCKSGRDNSLSNFAKFGTWGYGDNEEVFALNSRSLYYHPKTAMTADEVTALFADMIASETPPVVVGQLETPIEIDLSEEELAAYAALRTYKGNTTVINDSGAWMDLEYVMDAKKYIDSMIPTSGIIPATVE